MAEPYEYRSAGRSSLTVMGYAMIIAAVLIVARNGAGPILWTSWALATGALAHHLLSCQVAGLRLDDAGLTLFTDRRVRHFALGAIDHAVLSDCRACRCACTLHFTTGATRRLPARCLPPAATLARVLRRHGIKLIIDRSRARAPANAGILAANSSPRQEATLPDHALQ